MQAPLFDWPTPRPDQPGPVVRKFDPASERLLGFYYDQRVLSGAHPGSTRREVSQLRSLARQHDAGSVRQLFASPARLARALLEPITVISFSTGRCRLIAAQRFVRLC